MHHGDGGLCGRGLLLGRLAAPLVEAGGAVLLLPEGGLGGLLQLLAEVGAAVGAHGLHQGRVAALLVQGHQVRAGGDGVALGGEELDDLAGLGGLDLDDGGDLGLGGGLELQDGDHLRL